MLSTTQFLLDVVLVVGKGADPVRRVLPAAVARRATVHRCHGPIGLLKLDGAKKEEDGEDSPEPHRIPEPTID